MVSFRASAWASCSGRFDSWLIYLDRFPKYFFVKYSLFSLVVSAIPPFAKYFSNAASLSFRARSRSSWYGVSAYFPGVLPYLASNTANLARASS